MTPDDRERWQEQRHRALNALGAFLRERDIDRPLQSHVFAIHNHLGRFDNHEARRFALNEMEHAFRTRQDDDWAWSGRRALTLWRLHQQFTD